MHINKVEVGPKEPRFVKEKLSMFARTPVRATMLPESLQKKTIPV